jgi:hypothetical protein
VRGHRAVIDPVTLVLIVGLGGGFVLGSWKPLARFRPKPPTEQLTKLQGELEQAQKAAEQALKDKDAAQAAERGKLKEQIRAAQADNVGTETALKKVPKEHQSPEVKLAARMAQRVSLKLATAIGRLPADQQEAMVELVEQALSDKQAEVDEANRKLAALDADFKAITGEREQLKAQIPLLTEEARKAKENALAVQSEVTTKTQQVKEWANKADHALRENNSLWGSIQKGALLMGAAYLFFVFGLPGIVKHMQSDNPLKGLLRDASGYLTSPLLYSDAKTKLKSK